MSADGYGEIGSGAGEEVPSLEEIIESWDMPEGATDAAKLRDDLLSIAKNMDVDPSSIVHIAVGPLVTAVGKLEAALAAAERRITALEAHRNPPGES